MMDEYRSAVRLVSVERAEHVAPRFWGRVLLGFLVLWPVCTVLVWALMALGRS